MQRSFLLSSFSSLIFSRTHSGEKFSFWNGTITNRNAAMMWEFLHFPLKLGIISRWTQPQIGFLSQIFAPCLDLEVFVGRESTATYMLKYSANADFSEQVFCKGRFFEKKSIQLSAKADFYEKVLSKGRFLWKKYSAMADFSEENKSILQKNFSNGRFLWRKKYLAKADFSEKKYLQRQISLEKIFGKGRFIWRQFFC